MVLTATALVVGGEGEASGDASPKAGAAVSQAATPSTMAETPTSSAYRATLKRKKHEDR